MTSPILWSFRRCPYAIRGRLGLASAQVQVDLREIVLRDKPDAFLEASPSATVPCLVVDGQSIDESLDVMRWALAQNDPEQWLDMPQLGWDLIEECDGPFKAALDHTQYAVRYPDLDAEIERGKAMTFIAKLDDTLGDKDWLFGANARLADYAILPFIRQFANIDRATFDAQSGENVRRWLDAFLASDRFLSVMSKYEPWTAQSDPTPFPSTSVI